MATVAEKLLDVLVENGVDTIFGIPGGAVARLYAEATKRPELRVVNAAHEANAVFLAMGHALATGRPAVVMVTSGPGVTNALTGLASAHADGVPVLVIGGEVPRTNFGRGALQEGSAQGFNAMGMVRPVTKLAAQITRPGSATNTLRKVIATMMSGRQGPAFVSLPIDVANMECAAPEIAGFPDLRFAIDRNACRRAADLLSQAKRPLLLVGAGARSRKNRQMVLELAERTKTPVATTPKGKGVFPEVSPLYLGVLGFGGHESVIHYLENKPDVIVVVGSSLNDFSTNAWTPLLAASKAFIQIEIDACQIGKNYPVDLGLLGPMNEILEEIVKHVRDVQPRDAFEPFTVQSPTSSAKGMITTIEAVRAMNEVCPADAVFTSDMGEHLSVALHHLRTKHAGSFLTALGFGSMGSGVVSAIGHAMGDPSRRVYAICGDGGFLMSGNELQTAVQHNVDVTFVIMNDSGFNMCRHGINDLYGTKAECKLATVDFAQVAKGYGATGHVVKTPHELFEGLKPVRGPVVLDVRIDPDVRLQGSQRVAALRQFTDKQ